ncbi:MAG: 23S rRNA (pseudouridine(1915)-N(3))-methyltransferase RlmH [candidate division KSB1 bacterium]|nr:23S rRNA (pseudouridine(1915)-N(3))-methyltransferase RlmH [candidate division KSB1 bacterium]
MKLKLIAVGKIRERYLQMAESDFMNRLQRYTDLEIVTVKEERIERSKSEELITGVEAERICRKIKPQELVVALDSRGQQMSSEELAAFLKSCLLEGKNRLTFVIGGTLGLSEALLKQASVRLSLSRMTFTHEMTRVILLEQIYRAFTIIRGEKYHK